MEKKRMPLQHKIIFGYIILVAVIGSMIAILIYERRQMREVEGGVARLWRMYEDIYTTHRHVTGLAVLVETALIANADAVGVVVTGMCAYLILWTAGIEYAILCDVEVVADALETSSLVTGFQLLYCEILVDSSGTAVYHDQVNSSWILHWILWIIND